MSSSVPNASLESLLAHGRFLRPIARALLRGADGEDDVVQDTLLRAFRSQATPDRPASFWGRVARNLSLDRLRAARREAGLRHVVAADDVAPSPADVLQQEEQRARIVHAVLALPQPYRSVVLLRYWEDLTPAAIAARLTLPGATVRSQLARGLAMVRERLDAEFGDRRTWIGALAPAAGFGRGGDVVWRTILMTKTKFAVAGMVMLACGLGLWWMLADPTPLVPLQGNSPTTEAGVVAAAGLSPPPVATVAVPDAANANTRVATQAGELTVRGQVKHKGEPFPGFALTLQWFAGFDANGAPEAVFAVTSDVQGNFEWRGPMRATPGMVRAIASPHAVPAKLWCNPELVLPEQNEAELPVSVIPFDRVVFGRVHTRDGAPIAGAKLDINLWPETEVRSDAAGRYEMRVPAPGYGMTVRAAGFAERLIDSYLPEGVMRQEFDVELLPGTTLTGRVVDANGAPVAAAKVMASGAMHGVDSGPDGTFVVAGVRQGDRHRVTAQKPGFQVGAAFAVPGAAPVEIVLQAGLRIDLRVLGADAAPLAGAIVNLVADQWSGWQRLGITGPDGMFAALDLPSKAIELVVQRRGYQTARHTVDARDGKSELVVTMLQGFVIRGAVVDAFGKPVVGASIYCECKNSSSTTRAVGTRDDTDAQGRFEVCDVPAEPCTLFAYHDEYARGEFAFVGGTVAETTLQLVRALAFAGRVVDGVTGAPVTKFTIDVEPNRDHPVYVREQPFTAADGRWRFTHPQLPAGAAQTLCITAAGYAPSRVQVTPSHDAVADHTVVAMFAGVTVTGVVRDPANGQPLAGVTVALATADPRPRPNDGPATDASGKFTLDSVPAGEQRLRLQHAERPELVFGPFAVGKGPGTLEVQPTMGVGVTLRGRVLGASEVAGLTVSAFRDDGRTTKGTVGDGGEFELHGLGVGSTILHVRDGSGRVRMQRIAVGEVDLTGVELALRSGSGAVAVTIDGVTRGELAVRRLDPKPGEMRTHDEVEFAAQPVRLDGLAPGRYRVIATSEAGDLRGSADVDVGRGEVPVRVVCERK